MSTLSLYQGDLTKQVGAGEKTDRQRHVKTKRCCEKETRNGANTRIEQHLKGIMLAQICSKNRHKRTVEEKNEKI